MAKVFLSWSGDLSKKMAQELRSWIPCVLQAAKPYFTPDDIEKGARWSSEIAKELEDSSIGIVCLTRENIERPWIMFEAGALSKKLEKTFVCPILFGIDSSDLKGPLVQFQAVAFAKKEMLKLMETINNQCKDPKLDSAVLHSVFEKWWPDLERKVQETIAQHAARGDGKGKLRDDREILEEILELSRRNFTRSASAPRFNGSLPRGLVLDLVKVHETLLSHHIHEISPELSSVVSDLRHAISFMERRLGIPTASSSDKEEGARTE